MDLMRSWANIKSVCPERLISAGTSVRHHQGCNEARGGRAPSTPLALEQGLDTSGWELEVLPADFSDAYMH